MSELKPKPEATTEKPELYPGGTDAPVRDPDGEGLGRDLPPDLNPATEDVPEAFTEPDDKDQAPSGQAADHEAGTTEKSPAAGQVDEEGSPEPPA